MLPFKSIPLLLLSITITSYTAVSGNTQQDTTHPTLQPNQTAKPDSQFSDEQHKRLDMLFTRLAASDNEGAARQLIAEIWSIWKQPIAEELRTHMHEARRYYIRGQKKAAFAVLDDAIKAYPGCSEIWNQRATYYYYDGRYQESLEDIAKVLELEPRHFGALSGKIAILMRENRMEAALKTLRQALKINPFMPEASILLPKDKRPVTKPPGLAI